MTRAFELTLALTGFRTEAEAEKELSLLQGAVDLYKFLMRESKHFPKDYAPLKPVVAFLRALPEGKNIKYYYTFTICDPVVVEDPDGSWRVAAEIKAEEKPFGPEEPVRFWIKQKGKLIRLKGIAFGPANQAGIIVVRAGENEYSCFASLLERGNWRS